MNPAVAKLFAPVENPVLRSTAIFAVQSKNPVHVELLPPELLEPFYILACVAREFNEKAVDDFPLLRKRLYEEITFPETELAKVLLTGAGFKQTAPTYPERAYLNCEVGQVRLEYLPIGSRFRSCNRTGVIADKSPSRAIVEWEGQAQSRSFTNHKTGDEVTITSSGRQRQGCALDACVIPLYTTVSNDDREWATNAWKELTGVFTDDLRAAKRKR